MFDDQPSRIRNVISLADVRAQRQAMTMPALHPRVCRHCSALLGEGESEDDCSSAGFSAAPAAFARRLAE